MRNQSSELMEIAIDAELSGAGIHNVEVNVDATQQCYLSGEVSSEAQEAEAMEIALAHGPTAVHDGMHHEGQDVPDLTRDGRIGPYNHAGQAPLDAGSKILAGAHLGHRVFDSPVHPVVTGNQID
jgi:hypothetical protein